MKWVCTWMQNLGYNTVDFRSRNFMSLKKLMATNHASHCYIVRFGTEIEFRNAHPRSSSFDPKKSIKKGFNCIITIPRLLAPSVPVSFAPRIPNFESIYPEPSRTSS